ncbi:LysR substrate-binding domain-containing protein [Paenirhodobacter sp.]|uniref:LysR substrate-binding domain-containing protein n=1 Tax=Paenirhodobacter sp. TaxID=1965326 RepID=UPI003B405414
MRPCFGRINARIEELRLLGDVPSGLIRITTSKTAARTILWPVVDKLVTDYPEIQIEISTETRLTDITEDRFDAGIRMGEFVAPDMIAVKIGPPVRLAAVAAPGYFRNRPIPEHPDDLDHHLCLTMRYAPHARPYDWEFEKDGEEIVKKVSGPFIFNDSDMVIEAAKEGHGICMVTEPDVIDSIRDGSLRRVLADWCPPFDGFHLFYSGRRQVSSAMRLLIDRLRYRE